MKNSVFVAYFNNTNDVMLAYEQALIEDIEVLLLGTGGHNLHTQRPFIFLPSKKKLVQKTMLFFTENGVKNVQLLY